MADIWWCDAMIQKWDEPNLSLLSSAEQFVIKETKIDDVHVCKFYHATSKSINKELTLNLKICTAVGLFQVFRLHVVGLTDKTATFFILSNVY